MYTGSLETCSQIGILLLEGFNLTFGLGRSYCVLFAEFADADGDT